MRVKSINRFLKVILFRQRRAVKVMCDGLRGVWISEYGYFQLATMCMDEDCI